MFKRYQAKIVNVQTYKGDQNATCFKNIKASKFYTKCSSNFNAFGTLYILFIIILA